MMRTIQGTPYMSAYMHPMVTAWAGELSVMFDASREGLWSKGEAGPFVSFPLHFNDIKNAQDLSFGDTMRVCAADAFRCGSLMMSPNLDPNQSLHQSVLAENATFVYGIARAKNYNKCLWRPAHYW